MIVAALAYYDEPAEGLRRLALSLEGTADALVAVDGPWELFGTTRSKEPNSPAESVFALADAASEVELPLLGFSGLSFATQATKRDLLMRESAKLAGEGGWVLVVDGDEEVVDRREGLAELLETTDRNVAYVAGTIRGRRGDRGRWRRLFRADPRLGVRESHHGYGYFEGESCVEQLGGDPRHVSAVPAADASELIALEHDDSLRSPERKRDSRAYYVKRARSDER